MTIVAKASVKRRDYRTFGANVATLRGYLAAAHDSDNFELIVIL